MGARTRLIALGTTLAAVVALPAAVAGAASSAAPGSATLGGAPCELIPAARSASEVGGGPCEGVRPGGLVESKVDDQSNFCTLNFLFRGSNGRRYIGTAGHCVLGESSFDSDGGERTWRGHRGPLARDDSDERIGRYAYAVLEDPKDFALIRLRKRVEVNPQMCHFGGPTGINSDRPAGLVTLHYYGNGAVAGETVPARTLYAFGMPSRDHVYAHGPAAPGDSGAGVISADGRAVGALVSFGIHADSIGDGDLDAGAVGITRLAPQLERAGDELGLRLRLRTAPLA